MGLIRYTHVERARRFMDASRKKQGLSYVPHSLLQAEVHVDKSQTKRLCVARRAGKTYAAVADCIMQGMQASLTPVLHPDGHMMDLRPGVMIQVIGPSANLMATAMDTFELLIPEAWRVPSRGGYRWEDDMDMPTGMRGDKRMVMSVYVGRDQLCRGLPPRPDWRIEFMSAGAVGAGQGRGCDVTMFTECQMVPEKIWSDARPAMTDPVRRNRLLVEGIPAENPQHWSERLFRTCVLDDSGKYSAFKWTFAENPMNTPELLERIYEEREMMSRDEWRRFYLAESPSGYGGYFRYLDSVIWSGIEHDVPQAGKFYVAGLDHGGADHTVMVVKDAGDGSTVSNLVFESGSSRTKMLQGICAKVREWNIRRLAVDGTSSHGQHMVEDIAIALGRDADCSVRNIQMTGPDKARLYDNYKLAIENSWVRIPESYTQLHEELAAIKSELAQAGYRKFSSEGAYRDDWVDAEVLAFDAMDLSVRDRLVRAAGGSRSSAYRSKKPKMQRGEREGDDVEDLELEELRLDELQGLRGRQYEASRELELAGWV